MAKTKSKEERRQALEIKLEEVKWQKEEVDGLHAKLVYTEEIVELQEQLIDVVDQQKQSAELQLAESQLAESQVIK